MNSIIYNKLLLQANEAQHQGLTKLAEAITESINDEPIVDNVTYSYNQLKNDVYKDLWKVATKLIRYYNMSSVDTMKLHSDIETYAEKILDDLEITLDVDHVIKDTTEPKMPGEM